MAGGRRDNSKGAYFAAQRKNPTGHYTEFVVRVYYLTLKACGGRLGERVVRRIAPGPGLLPWGEWRALVAAALEED